MVRLLVVSDEDRSAERAADDATLAENPRPRRRGDCGPLPCPHCGRAALMRLGEDAHGRLKVSCPDCKGRVLSLGNLGDRQEWLPVFDDDFEGEAGFPLLPVSPEMLNHCRPCAWAGCIHNLYLDVMDSGASIRFNFPGTGPDGLNESCSLDVADRGGATLDEVGKTINITRERARQLIEQAMRTFKRATNPMFEHTYIDMEDPGEIGETRHPLEDAE